MRFSWFGFVDWIRFRPGYQIGLGVAFWSMVPSTVCMVFAQGNLLGNVGFLPPSSIPLGGAPILRLGPVEMVIVACPACFSSFCDSFYPKLGSVGLCSKKRVLCFRASPVKQRYYAQIHDARLEVYMVKLCQTKMTPTHPPLSCS